MRHWKKSLRQPTNALPNRVDSPHPLPENQPMSQPVVGADNPANHRFPWRKRTFGNRGLLGNHLTHYGEEAIESDIEKANVLLKWLKTLEIVQKKGT